MKSIWWLRKFCFSLPHKSVEMLARREKPHPLALRETEIRIVSFETSLEIQIQQDDVLETLKLL